MKHESAPRKRGNFSEMVCTVETMKQRLEMHDTLVWSLRMCRPFNVLSLSTFFVAYGQMCSQWQITTSIIEKKRACLPTPAAVTPQNCG